MCDLTNEERRALLLLISRPETEIRANEAQAVFFLQQKLGQSLPPVEEPQNRASRRRAKKAEGETEEKVAE